MDLVGAEAAGPLLFDLLEAVGPRGRAAVKEDTVPPPDLTLVEVCAYSGHLPTDACKERRKVYARRSAVPTAAVPLPPAVEVDAKTGLAVSPLCRAGRADGVPRVPHLARQHPPLADGAAPQPARASRLRARLRARGRRARARKILSPAEGQVALLIPGVSPEQQEVPLEAEAAHDRELTWFVNGKFLGKAKADERLWWTPSVGTHEILVTDDRGLSSRRLLMVRARPLSLRPSPSAGRWPCGPGIARREREPGRVLARG